MASGEEFRGKDRGGDPKTDLAVIKVSRPRTSLSEIRPTRTTAGGEWVVAIGNPRGLEQTVTAGSSAPSTARPY